MSTLTSTASADAVPADEIGALAWWRAADDRARRAFVAASLGWMLDSFDVMLYSLVLASLIQDPTLQLTPAVAGRLGSLTLVAAAIGGIAFGVIADRIGRKRALMASVMVYSIFTAACGFAQTVTQLAIFRIFLGFGMGGEWATGVALVSETFPARFRGKALAFVQSSWAIGYGLAALVNWIVMPLWGWRGVFLVGVLPALFTIWIRQHLEEPALWRQSSAKQRGNLGQLFTSDLARVTVFITFMNACCLFGWWGLNLWVPAYLNLPPAQGGVGLSSATMSWFVIVMQVGMWFGYITFGYAADLIGRKRAYIIFVLAASVLLPLYGVLRTPGLLLVLGPLVAFFGTGYYSGFGAVIAELYPTPVRATAAGFCYNLGRIASAAAPFVVGSMAASSGFGVAFAITGAAFLLACIAWIGIPETGNRELRS
jgi:MFS family permease